MKERNFVTSSGHRIHYYESGAGSKTFVFIHAQGTDSSSYFDVSKTLEKQARVVLVDCFGHGRSTKDNSLYRLDIIGDAIAELISAVTEENVTLVGHSSGGLIASYIASKTNLCEKLILEDPPFFASQGERRFSTFNYVDLSTICHNYLAQQEERDFVLYYFSNQYAWNFFPEKSRKKIRQKLIRTAAAYRQKHPDKSLKVLFWPKAASDSFKGMNNYDPWFGENFYNDLFHTHIDYPSLLRGIECETIFLKAKTNIDNNGLQMCALSEDDLKKVMSLIPKCSVIHFDCGHGIHVEKKKDFLAQCLKSL